LSELRTDLDEAFLQLHSLNSEKNKAVEGLRKEIMDLEAEMEALSVPYDTQISELQAKIIEEVKVLEKPFKCQYGKATYRKEYERSSWDTKALTGYAAAHPEIEQFKKITVVEASVSVSVGDLE
jgi:hypothetical protein